MLYFSSRVFERRYLSRDGGVDKIAMMNKTEYFLCSRWSAGGFNSERETAREILKNSDLTMVGAL